MQLLHAALRNVIMSIASEYERQFGARNTVGKLFINISKDEEKAYLADIRSKDAERIANARKGLKAAVIGIVEGEDVNYKEPYLLELIMNAVGGKDKTFKNVAIDKGCIVVDNGKAFALPAKKAAPAAVAPAAVAEDEKPKGKAKGKKSKPAEDEDADDQHED